MTNELAIRILTGDVLGTTEQTQEAVTMAVRALSQPNVPDTNVGDTIYRRAAIDEILGQPLELHYPSWYAEQIKALPSARSDLESAYAQGYTAAEADFYKRQHTETHSCDYERTRTHDWIQVTERPPEDGVTVWVTIKGHDVITCEDGETLEQAIARISKIRWVWQGFWSETEKSWCSVDGFPMMVQPVAWMPMEVPEPWRGGQDDES